MEYTKGDWYVKDLNIMCDGKRIGQSFLMNFKHDKRGRHIQDTEVVANAKLMSSAPKLLDALKDLVRYCEDNDNGAVLDLAKEAIECAEL